MAGRVIVALASFVSSTLLAGCAGSRGDLPWSVSHEPPELGVDYVAHFYVVRAYVPPADSAIPCLRALRASLSAVHRTRNGRLTASATTSA